MDIYVKVEGKTINLLKQLIIASEPENEIPILFKTYLNMFTLYNCYKVLIFSVILKNLRKNLRVQTLI